MISQEILIEKYNRLLYYCRLNDITTNRYPIVHRDITYNTEVLSYQIRSCTENCYKVIDGKMYKGLKNILKAQRQKDDKAFDRFLQGNLHKQTKQVAPRLTKESADEISSILYAVANVLSTYTDSDEDLIERE